MDFVSLDGNNLKLNLPDISMWTWSNWVLLILICNAIYGFVTHLVSLPAIHRYRRNVDKRNQDQLTDGHLFLALLLRMTFQGPCRVFMLIIGMIWLFCVFIATLKPRINEPLEMAFMWYYSPKDLANALN